MQFQNVNEIKFISLCVRFKHLEEWFRKRYYSLRLGDIADKNHSLTISINKHEPIKTEVKEKGFTFVISPPSVNTNGSESITISQEAWVKISMKHPTLLDCFMEDIRSIQHFLCLGMGYPTYPIKIKGEIGSTNNQIVDIYFGANISLGIEKFNVYSHEMLFTLPIIEERIHVYLNRWIEMVVKYEPVLSLFFSTVYNSYQYLETDFLNLIHAIETYHRTKYGGKFQTDEEYLIGIYIQLVNALPQGLCADFKRSLLEGKLKYANEFSLRRRLREIMKNDLADFPFSFVTLPEERKLFIDKVCNTRNYLTHYTVEQRWCINQLT